MYKLYSPCFNSKFFRIYPTSSPGLFPQKMGGAGPTHFLRKKPWGRGWNLPFENSRARTSCKYAVDNLKRKRVREREREREKGMNQ